MPVSVPPRAREIGVAVLAIFAAVVTAVVLVRHSDFMDLGVYEWAGRVAFEPSQLYAIREPQYSLKFAYTPFSAVVFAAMQPVGLLAPMVFSLLSLAALARSCVLVARHAPKCLVQHHRRGAAVILISLAVLLEPGMETLRLGQVNFLLAWLVFEDLLGPRRWWSGALAGLAAAIKLTPAIFLVLLLLAGRVRAALVGAAAFGVAGAAAFVLLPTESREFWAGTGADADRFGGIEFVGNQSWNGVLLRLTEGDGSRALWLLGAALLAAAALPLARAWWLGGDRVAAIGLTGLAGLYISPLSWTHHWVIALPLLVALWVSGHRAARGVVVAALIVFASRVVWRVPQGQGREFHHSWLEAVAASSYVLAGIALLAAAFVARPRSIHTSR